MRTIRYSSAYSPTVTDLSIRRRHETLTSSRDESRYDIVHTVIGTSLLRGRYLHLFFEQLAPHHPSILADLTGPP
jgi:hypothetical protein